MRDPAADAAISAGAGRPGGGDGSPMAPITTERLVLEPLVAAHAEAMFGVLANTELYRYLDSAAPQSVDDLTRTYARLESCRSADGSDLWLNWIIRERGKAPIGYVQATVVAQRAAWIAYVLSPLHQGRGHAREATLAMLEHLATASGTIAPDGNALLRLDGIVNNPEYAVNNAQRGKAYSYRVRAVFQRDSGTGRRIGKRQCAFRFARH